MVDITYRCPRCGTLADLERDGRLADKTVTPYPLEGWSYARPNENFEERDGVRIVCGEAGPNVSFRPGPGGNDGTDRTGCGEPFYLSFVRFEDGREVEPDPPSEHVELAPEGPRTPRGPGGPRGPGER